MIESAGPIIIALWVVAIILGITTNFLKIRDHLINWYKKKAKRIVPSKMVNNESSIKMLNFSHPITHTQKDKIENILQKPIKEIIVLPTQLDESSAIPVMVVNACKRRFVYLPFRKHFMVLHASTRYITRKIKDERRYNFRQLG